jgi:hypothetical protein
MTGLIEKERKDKRVEQINVRFRRKERKKGKNVFVDISKKDLA